MKKWELLGKVTSSTYRQTVVYSLANGKMTPKDIAKDSGIKFSNISTVLRQLVDIGVAQCLTPNLKKGRIYTLTARGKKLVKELL